MGLTDALGTFERQFNLGIFFVWQDARLLFNLLFLFEVVFAGFYLALGSNSALHSLAKRFIAIGFLHFTLLYWNNNLKIFTEGFINEGALAGGSRNVQIDNFKNPESIIVAGFKAVEPAMTRLKENDANSWIPISAKSLIMSFFLLLTLMGFFIMAIQVFVTYLEYILISSCALILVPFGAFKPTAFLAEKAFGAVIAYGIKLMVLAAVISVSSGILQNFVVPTGLEWRPIAELACLSLAIAFLSWHAPSVAVGLMNGQPSLSFGMVAGAAASTGVAASLAAPSASAAVGSGGRMAAAALGGAIGGATSGGGGSSSLGSGAVGAATSGSSTPGSSAAQGGGSAPMSGGRGGLIGAMTGATKGVAGEAAHLVRGGPSAAQLSLAANASAAKTGTADYGAAIGKNPVAAFKRGYQSSSGVNAPSSNDSRSPQKVSPSSQGSA